jgi:acetoin utilization deacetylase AcuC-like enzyme
MYNTAVVFTPKCYQHNPGKSHPESPKRLTAIMNELKRNRLLGSESWQFVYPKKASLGDVKLVHGIEYIRLVEAVCKAGGGLLDLQDTVVSSESFEAALYAVGGTLKAVDLVMTGESRNAFALVRPPGHHAGRFRALGFCIFNNIAIAAEHLLEEYKLQRVAILDIDAHHGNGTQEAFYETSKVLYLSLHEDPSSFPGTGFVEENGDRKGLGYKVNIPLPYQTCDDIYLKAMKEIAAPIMRQYQPQFILVSAGFDAHYRDPVGNLSLSAWGIQQVYAQIVNLASETCQGRIVSVLEGGYNLNTIGKLVAIAIARMSGSPYITKDKGPANSERVESQGEKILERVKKVQNSFWHIG